MAVRSPSRRAPRTPAALVAAAALLVACSGDDRSSSASTAPVPSVVTAASSSVPTGRTNPAPTPSTSPSTTAVPSTTQAAPVANSIAGVKVLLEAAARLRRFSLGEDTLGVYVCHVGRDIKDSIYNAVDFRLDLHPDRVTRLLDTNIGAYYRALSFGQYRPHFISGGEVSIAGSETNRDCVDKALAASTPHMNAVVVVADAEHGSTQPGGWGRSGTPCTETAPCSAKLTGRATYIGASDFHPDWGAIPAVDLEEHEIGHSLGFPHSGNEEGHDSGLDLMSNSAAPRDVQPDRRNAPDTLGVNRLAAGWLPVSDVAVAPAAGGTFELVPSNTSIDTGPDTRLLILPLEGVKFLTVEVLDNRGFDDFLAAPGVVVTQIDQSPSGCRSRSSGEMCLDELRRQTPLSSPSPYTTLMGPGTSWSGQGWTVKVVSAHDGTWTIQITSG